MSGLYAPESVSDSDKLYAGQLMEAVGKVCWVEQESGINNIIAAAGSSPAYFFLFMEAMQKEAQAQGFSEETARELVQQSALGAAQMVVANPQLDLETLRAQVTSKGGTTHKPLRPLKITNFRTRYQRQCALLSNVRKRWNPYFKSISNKELQ